MRLVAVVAAWSRVPPDDRASLGQKVKLLLTRPDRLPQHNQ